MDSPEYIQLFPDTRLNGKNIVSVSQGALRNSEIFEIVNNEGVYRSAGVGGGITGMGARLALLMTPLKMRKKQTL